MQEKVQLFGTFFLHSLPNEPNSIRNKLATGGRRVLTPCFQQTVLAERDKFLHRERIAVLLLSASNRFYKRMELFLNLFFRQTFNTGINVQNSISKLRRFSLS